VNQSRFAARAPTLAMTLAMALAMGRVCTAGDDGAGGAGEGAGQAVPGVGVPGSWEAGLDASFQRLDGSIVSSEWRLGASLGYYCVSWLEPFAAVSLDIQQLDGGKGSEATATNVGAGAGLRASFEVVDRVHPYLSLSPGALVRTTDRSGFDHAGRTDFTASIEAGVQLVVVPRVAIDVGVGYQRIFSDQGEDLLTVPLGLSFFF
jgi:hypothetical protein